MEIPNTHRYHHYSFSIDDGEQSNIQHIDATTPPLHLQLMALTTKELERRINNIPSDNTSTTTHSKTHKGNRICKVHQHASLAYHLARAMGNDRITKHCNGVSVGPNVSTVELLQYLRTYADTLWPSREKKRRGVSSGGYMTVRTNHPPEYDLVWQLCEQLIWQVIPDAVYNALAITKSFRGSPHIDNHDKTFQHVIGLGDYKSGCLCTEADEDGNEVVQVDVKNKFGRIDGRSVHWVSGWTGERYSIVYYSTSDDDYTEQLPQRVHTRWMQKKSGIVPQRSYAPNNLRLPNTTPILGLGCSSFSTFFTSGEEDVTPLTVDNMSRNHPAVIEWIETIRHAVLNRGIFLLDTAPWYGHGISEVTVGYALDSLLHEDGEQVNEQSPSRTRTGFLPRSSLIVNTKVGRYEADPLFQFDFTYDTTIRSVQRSLERMNCTYIDVIQLHDPEFAPNISILIEETIPALLECRKQGWVKGIGITGYPLDVQHQILVECQTTFDDVVFDQSLVYCHNNLHDMSLFDDRCFPSLNEERLDEKDDREKDNTITFAQYCQQSNIYLMAAAPLSMGLLTNNSPPNWHPASTLLKEACSAAAKLCESKDINISSLALLYSLSQKDIPCTLLGMRNVEEVDVAADLAMRFYIDSVDEENTNKGSTSSGCNNLLDEILSPKEKAILEMLLDKEHSPFSSVISSGQYRWDGKEEANKFRKMVGEMKRNRTT